MRRHASLIYFFTLPSFRDLASVVSMPSPYHVHVCACVQSSGGNGLQIASKLVNHFVDAGIIGHNHESPSTRLSIAIYWGSRLLRFRERSHYTGTAYHQQHPCREENNHCTCAGGSCRWCCNRGLLKHLLQGVVLYTKQLPYWADQSRCPDNLWPWHPQSGNLVWIFANAFGYPSSTGSRQISTIGEKGQLMPSENGWYGKFEAVLSMRFMSQLLASPNGIGKTVS